MQAFSYSSIIQDGIQLSELPSISEFEKVLSFTHPTLHISGAIAIHNTVGGPALGGCRIHSYPSFQAGLHDVLSLAQAMTYKNTIMNLPYGGGKTVIFQNNQCDRHSIFKVLAAVLNYLKGQYIVTDDVGTSVEDMYFLRKFTQYAKGIYSNKKQIPATSYGIYQAMKATLNFYQNLNSLEGIKIFVLGLGKVGFQLCNFLHEEGCIIYVYDPIEMLMIKAKREFNAVPLKIDQIKDLEIDILSPCALGGSINESILSKIKPKYIIGGENNPLGTFETLNLLSERGIIYIPDYLSNAGGVIDIACEEQSYSEEYVFAKVSEIFNKTTEILQLAHIENKTPLEVSNQYVQDRLVFMKSISNQVHNSNTHKECNVE